MFQRRHTHVLLSILKSQPNQPARGGYFTAIVIKLTVFLSFFCRSGSAGRRPERSNSWERRNSLPANGPGSVWRSRRERTTDPSAASSISKWVTCLLRLLLLPLRRVSCRSHCLRNEAKWCTMLTNYIKKLPKLCGFGGERLLDLNDHTRIGISKMILCHCARIQYLMSTNFPFFKYRSLCMYIHTLREIFLNEWQFFLFFCLASAKETELQKERIIQERNLVSRKLILIYFIQEFFSLNRRLPDETESR